MVKDSNKRFAFLLSSCNMCMIKIGSGWGKICIITSCIKGYLPTFHELGIYAGISMVIYSTYIISIM